MIFLLNRQCSKSDASASVCDSSGDAIVLATTTQSVAKTILHELTGSSCCSTPATTHKRKPGAKNFNSPPTPSPKLHLKASPKASPNRSPKNHLRGKSLQPPKSSLPAPKALELLKKNTKLYSTKSLPDLWHRRNAFFLSEDPKESSASATVSPTNRQRKSSIVRKEAFVRKDSKAKFNFESIILNQKFFNSKKSDPLISEVKPDAETIAKSLSKRQLSDSSIEILKGKLSNGILRHASDDALLSADKKKTERKPSYPLQTTYSLPSILRKPSFDLEASQNGNETPPKSPRKVSFGSVVFTPTSAPRKNSTASEITEKLTTERHCKAGSINLPQIREEDIENNNSPYLKSLKRRRKSFAGSSENLTKPTRRRKFSLDSLAQEEVIVEDTMERASTSDTTSWYPECPKKPSRKNFLTKQQVSPRREFLAPPSVKSNSVRRRLSPVAFRDQLQDQSNTRTVHYRPDSSRCRQVNGFIPYMSNKQGPYSPRHLLNRGGLASPLPTLLEQAEVVRPARSLVIPIFCFICA